MHVQQTEQAPRTSQPTCREPEERTVRFGRGLRTVATSFTNTCGTNSGSIRSATSPFRRLNMPLAGPRVSRRRLLHIHSFSRPTTSQTNLLPQVPLTRGHERSYLPSSLSFHGRMLGSQLSPSTATALPRSWYGTRFSKFDELCGSMSPGGHASARDRILRQASDHL